MGCEYSQILPTNFQEDIRKRKTKRQNSAKPEPTSKEILQNLADLGIIKNARSATGGVAFDIGNTDLPARHPRRLEKLDHKSVTGIQYSADQKGLMADILKNNEAKEKACKLEQKMDKAKRRRMYKEAERKNKLEERRQAKEERMKKHAEKTRKNGKE